MRDIEPISRLAAKFASLPGVGQKTALRYAYAVIKMSQKEADEFISAISDIKDKVKFCSICGNYTDIDPCLICTKRDRTHICVVAYPKDVTAMEKVRGYEGTYHVLGGTLSPLDGRGPEELRVKELLARISKDNVQEVILALNPDIEGEATAMYLAKLIKPLGVKVSKIAQGISIGSELEYTDEVTLSKAFERREII